MADLETVDKKSRVGKRDHERQRERSIKIFQESLRCEAIKALAALSLLDQLATNDPGQDEREQERTKRDLRLYCVVKIKLFNRD